MADGGLEDWPFGALKPSSYDLIMADPPWHFAVRSEKTGTKKSAQAHYRCMDLENIKALPVNQLASNDAILWLWATAPMLPQALETLQSWGFRYITCGAWAKRSLTGRKWAFGTGYTLRSAAELFLIGKIGSPKNAKNVRNLVDARVGEHSEKPQAAYDTAKALLPGAKCVELFARTRRDGWDVWGDEVMP